MFGAAGLINKKKCSFLWDDKDMEQFVLAVQENNPKALRKKIGKRKVEINELLRFESGVEKMSAIHFAAKEGYYTILQELIHNGVDVNITTQYDCLTPLHLACQYHNMDIAVSMSKLLIRAGACVNARDHCNRTPLIAACEMGHLDLVLLLLENGAEMNHRCDREDFPVMVNWVQDYSPILPNRAVTEVSDPYQGNNALMQACREHQFDIVQELVERKCHLDLSNLAGNTALHISCKSHSRFAYMHDDCVHLRLPVVGHPQIVQVLVNGGIDLNLRNNNDETAVYRAISCLGDIATMNGDQELSMMCYDSTLQIIDILVCAGCDTTYRGKGNDRSLLTQLLTVRAHHLGDYRNRLEDKMYSCACLLIATGCRVCDNDLVLYDASDKLATSSTPCATPHGEASISTLSNNASMLSTLRDNMPVVGMRITCMPSGSRKSRSRSITSVISGYKREMSLDSISYSGCTDFEALLRSHIHTPLALKQLSRIAIRRLLPQPVSQTLRRLSLPAPLKLYISLKFF